MSDGPKVIQIGLAMPNDEVIEQAELLLRDAKSGKLRSIAWVGDVGPDGVNSGYTYYGDWWTMIGHLERLKYRMMRKLDEHAVDSP
jgi:hypothetical protein